MKIEAGKSYVNRMGQKVGPAEPSIGGDPGGFFIDDYGLVKPNGEFGYGSGWWSEDLDLVAEWVDPGAAKLWRDMTPEEKGALLLAHHEGKAIESWFAGEWVEIIHTCPKWADDFAYRVKPEPKRKTVTLYGAGYEWEQASVACSEDTHRITFDLIDGKPDCASIRMEELE